jgi:hypothetical protein
MPRLHLRHESRRVFVAAGALGLSAAKARLSRIRGDM